LTAAFLALAAAPPVSLLLRIAPLLHHSSLADPAINATTCYTSLPSSSSPPVLLPQLLIPQSLLALCCPSIPAPRAVAALLLVRSLS
jgi:hypothetical protein